MLDKGMQSSDWDPYAKYDKCVPCAYMSFQGCTHPYHDDIGDVNGCEYFDAGERE